MNDILFAAKEQIYETAILFISFFKKTGWVPVLGCVALAATAMRRWETKTIASFLVVIFLALVAYVRLEAFFLSPTFSADGSDLAVSVLRIISVIIVTFIFFFHAAVKN